MQMIKKTMKHRTAVELEGRFYRLVESNIERVLGGCPDCAFEQGIQCNRIKTAAREQHYYRASCLRRSSNSPLLPPAFHCDHWEEVDELYAEMLKMEEIIKHEK